jgi:hypothetical protein
MRHYWLTSDFPDLPAGAFRKSVFRDRPATLEGGKGGSAPAAPDPYQTAQAQTQTNTQTAQFNKALNQNNYTNPFASQQSAIVGTDPATGAPIYNTTIQAGSQLQGNINDALLAAGNSNGINSSALSGLQGLNGQYAGLNSSLGALQNQYQGLNSGISGLGGQYSGLMGQLAGINNSIDPNAGNNAQLAGQNAAYAAQTQYLDPQFSQQKESLDAQLANQGLTPGSEAYNNAMTNYNNQKQQAYSNAQNQSILTGSQIGAQSLQNQLNAANAKAGLVGQQGILVGNQAGLFGLQASNLGQQAGLYGQQASNLGQQAGLYGQQVGIGQTPYSNLGSLAQLIPGYTGLSSASANPADISGAINNNYQAQLANHNADVQSANSTTGAVAGLAGMAALAFF